MKVKRIFFKVETSSPPRCSRECTCGLGEAHFVEMTRLRLNRPQLFSV